MVAPGHVCVLMLLLGGGGASVTVSSTRAEIEQARYPPELVFFLVPGSHEQDLLVASSQEETPVPLVDIPVSRVDEELPRPAHRDKREKN